MFGNKIDCVTDDSEAVEVGLAVRRLQQKCKFSQLQTTSVVETIKKSIHVECDLRGADRKLKRQSCVTVVVLHGCIAINEHGQNCGHVFGPKDKRLTCPRCGQSRFQVGSTTKANEQIYWFPLKPRIEALLQLDNYRSLLQVTSTMNQLCIIWSCLLVFLCHLLFLNCFMFNKV